MSKTISIDAGSTVVVINVNTPGSNQKGPGNVTIGPSETIGPVEEPAEKHTRTGQLFQQIPSQYLETLKPPPEAASWTGEESAFSASALTVPTCTTESPVPKNLEGHESPLALQVGFNGDIPRWRPGSVVKFATYAQGYRKPDDARYAAQQLAKAANAWNALDIGVKFEWVQDLEEACFALAYGGDNGGVLASAFFPNGNDLNHMYVFQSSFGSAWKPHMWEVFTHELGHVLGLRHEFAMDLGPNGKPREGGSVQFGARDEYSVMNYRQEPPKITELDAKNARAFYAYTGRNISDMAIQDWIPN